MKDGDYEKSLEQLREAFTQFPEDESINARLAVCHFKLGAVSLCLRFLESALKQSAKAYTEFEYYIPEDLQFDAIKELIQKYK